MGAMRASGSDGGRWPTASREYPGRLVQWQKARNFLPLGPWGYFEPRVVPVEALVTVEDAKEVATVVWVAEIIVAILEGSSSGMKISGPASSALFHV